MKTIRSSLVLKGLGAAFAFAFATAGVAQTTGHHGLAQGEYKFLGNISASSNGCSGCASSSYFDQAFDYDNPFHNLWNQVTPENAGKWGSVEGTRGTFNFATQDRIWGNSAYFIHAMRFHTLVWGSQLPGWWYRNPQLSRQQRIDAVETFIRQTCEPFSLTAGTTSGYRMMIDVVNEPLNTPNRFQPESSAGDFNLLVAAWDQFTNGTFPLPASKYPGGRSSRPEWDWIVWSFEKARQYCPTSALMLNEFNLFNNSKTIRQGVAEKDLLPEYKALVNLLKGYDLIDGVGAQTHHFEVDSLADSDAGVNTIMTNLNSLAETGLPIFITELDITGCTNLDLASNCTESRQRDRYRRLFPKLWESNKVHGVTLWGAIQNEVWIRAKDTNATVSHLIKTDGSDTLAMTWLKSYFNTRRSNGAPSPNDITVPSFLQYMAPERQFEVRAKGTAGTEKIRLLVNDKVVASWTLTTSMKTYFTSSTQTGAVKVEFYNDASGRDVQVDYLTINGVKRQAESQPINTAAYQNGRCGGGSGRTEQMHCNGFINFRN